VTIGSIALPASSTPARATRRVTAFAELLLVGGATLFLFPLAWLLRRQLGLDAADYAVGFTAFYGAYAVNDPHFAVTYFLFYRDARRRAFSVDVPLAQRARYWLAGAVVPGLLVVWATAALALHWAQSLGWMVQLMYLLVGWHYAKQGFGVLAVLCARRGVVVTARERTALLFHCYAAWAYAWASPATRAGEYEEKGIVYFAPAKPHVLEVVTGAVLAASVVVLAIALATRWARERGALPAAPLLGFLITIWSWTIYSTFDPLVQYVIPALHSIQYLYFVWLMRRNEARAHEGPPTFGRPVAVQVGGLAIASLALGWLLFHGVPGFLDAALVPRAPRGAVPGPMGETPFIAAFFVMVSIHHYAMDAVVWRRENPDTRYLAR
jgi:hypothetical protein